jgi:hypothetical protein
VVVVVVVLVDDDPLVAAVVAGAAVDELHAATRDAKATDIAIPTTPRHAGDCNLRRPLHRRCEEPTRIDTWRLTQPPASSVSATRAPRSSTY